MSNLTNYPAPDSLEDTQGNLNAVTDVVSKTEADSSEQFDLYRKRATEKLENSDKWVSRRNASIVSFVIGAHIVGGVAFLNAHHDPVVIPKKKEVLVEFIRPVVPEQKIEPPPPPPKKVERTSQPAKSAPALKTQVAQQDIHPDDITVQENTTAQHSSEPVAAVPTTPPAPVAAIPTIPPEPKEEPVTEATGYAGYLNNPPPEYPMFAQRQGWQGKVILRVRVLANGRAGIVEVKQSSGRKILDDAAQEVVKTWMFAPAKRGNTPIDGWATVPIEFRVGK